LNKRQKIFKHVSLPLDAEKASKLEGNEVFRLLIYRSNILGLTLESRELLVWEIQVVKTFEKDPLNQRKKFRNNVVKGSGGDIGKP